MGRPGDLRRHSNAGRKTVALRGLEGCAHVRGALGGGPGEVRVAGSCSVVHGLDQEWKGVKSCSGQG